MGWLLGAAGLMAIAIPSARRVCPRWVVGVLIALIWAVLDHAGMICLRVVVSPMLPPAWPNPSLGTLITRRVLFSLPHTLFLFVPAAAAIFSLSRRRSGATWVEWAGVLLVSAWWLSSEIAIGLASFRIWRGPQLATNLTIRFAELLIAACLSALIVARLGPAWSRWLGLGYDGSHPSPIPPEA